MDLLTSRASFGGRAMPNDSLSFVPNAKLDLLMYALGIMVWTYVWRIQDLFSITGALKPSLLATGLCVALLALDHQQARRVATLKSPILICGIAVLAIGFIGIPTSLYASRSANLVLTGLLSNLLLMILLAASIRGLRDLEWIALANVLGACLFCLYVNLAFDVGPSGQLSEELVYYDPNDLALVLVCTIPFAIFFIVRGGWPSLLLATLSLVLFVATIVKTGSRGGFIGLVAVLAYVVIAYRAIPKRVRIGAVIGVVGLLVVTASEGYWEEIRTLRNPKQDYNWSGEGRVAIWKRGLRYMASRPVVGVGMGNFSTAEGVSEESRAQAERGAGFKWSAAHNTFLEIGVELGVIALALFVAMLVTAFRLLRRIRRSRPPTIRRARREAALASSLSASLVGFIVSGFFLSAAYFSYVYMILGLVIGFAKIDRGSVGRWGRWTARGMAADSRERLIARAARRKPAMLR